MAKLVTKEGIETNLEDGSSLIHICKDLGVPFGCQNGVCGTCQIDILDGEENLSELNELETDMGMNKKHRLACQCKIIKDKVTIDF